MKYEQYSPSIIRWNHEYPTHWSCEKAKRFFANPKKLNKGNEESNVLSLTLRGVIRNNGEKPIGLSPSDYSTYQIFDSGELVFKLIDLNNISTSRVGMVPEKGIMSSAYIRFVPRADMNIKYFYYQYYDWYKRNIFNGLGEGVRQTLSGNDLRNLEILIPPREEQDQIVRYLDWQVSKINKLIAAKKKQIALLRERAQKLIQDVVFHGITNGRTLETYDGLWIGSIPSDWNVKRIKNLFSLRDERNHMPLTDVNLISLYTSLGVVQNCDVEYKSGNKARTAENYKIVHNGDIVVNIILCWMGAVGLSKYNGVTSPAYDIYVPNSQVSSRYYHYLFRLPVFSGECKKVGHGIMAMRWRTYSPEFRSIYVPVPPYEEQEQIADWLDKHMSEIEKLIEPFKQEIDTLHELRTRLISDVVTGQIDVRGIEVPDFDMVEEIDSDEENLDDEDAAEETEEQEE